MPATDIGRKRIVSTAEMLRVPRPGGELHARILHRIWAPWDWSDGKRRPVALTIRTSKALRW